MNDLTMDKVQFFKLIILPFVSGRIFAWFTARMLITSILRRRQADSSDSNGHWIALTIACLAACYSCFCLINALVVTKLEQLEYVSPKHSGSFFLNGLPALILAICFIRQSVNNIASPRA